MAARAGLLEDEASRLGKSILVIAQEHVVRLSWLRLDIPADDPEILNALCQFDLFACAVELGTPGGKSSGSFLPHFYRWDSHRSDPAAVALIDNPDACAALFFPHSDLELARALRAIAQEASQAAFHFNGWEGYRDPRIVACLQENTEEKQGRGLGPSTNSAGLSGPPQSARVDARWKRQAEAEGNSAGAVVSLSSL